LVLATGNPDKAREITEIFVTRLDKPLAARALTVGGETFGFLVDRLGTSATRPLDDDVDDFASAPDVEETGSTLEENARIKASALAHAAGVLAVADDTGLEVDALEGAPGVYSARYSGPDATYADNVAKLLREMEGVYPALRTARFATVALARWPDGREIAVRGEVEGVITAAVAGDNGFGYDPVFVPTEGDGRTFAQMSGAEKHAVSHRGRAFTALVDALLASPR
jgi:XTP/dITP diphosphohydrolase